MIYSLVSVEAGAGRSDRNITEERLKHELEADFQDYLCGPLTIHKIFCDEDVREDC